MENLSDISDMYKGQIIYYYSKFYFIQDKLKAYTVKFNQYVNNNFDYTEDTYDSSGNNSEDSENNNENSENNNKTKKTNKENGKCLINTYNSGVLVITSHKLKTHFRDKTSSNKKPDKEYEYKTDNDNKSIKIKDNKMNLMKKYYKKLALKCHPDRVDDIKLNFYFIESQTAMKERKLTYLLFLVYKANISLFFENDNEVSFIQSELEIMEKNIKDLTNKIEWKWCSINNNGLKNSLINNYALGKKLKRKVKKAT